MYLTKVSGSGALVNEIRDFHPAGFQLVKARLNVKWLIGNQQWEDVTGTAVVGNNAVIAKGGGWTTAGGGVIALETTYKVPDNATVGSKLDSGAGTNIVLAAGDWNINPMGVCVTVRPPNPVEAGSGSLEDLGFGSVNTGSGQVFGSVTDPQGSITNVVGGNPGQCARQPELTERARDGRARRVTTRTSGSSVSCPGHDGRPEVLAFVCAASGSPRRLTVDCESAFR